MKTTMERINYMEKQKLQKMKILEATDEMVQAAEKDLPIINNLPYEKMT